MKMREDHPEPTPEEEPQPRDSDLPLIDLKDFYDLLMEQQEQM